MYISIVIPTYEEIALHNTLNNLINQSAFNKYKGEIEIIIVDYDPNNTKKTFSSYNLFYHLKPPTNIITQFISINEKGIAKARDLGIKNAHGSVIVNFDADARFLNNTDLENLVDPIMMGKCVITCCDNILDSFEFGINNNNTSVWDRIMGIAAYEALNTVQRDNLIVTLEPGMSFTKYAYEYSGGFFDVRQAEAITFSPKLIYNFGIFCKKHIKEAVVIVSPRRINSISKHGLLNILNYDNAFRGKDLMKLN